MRQIGYLTLVKIGIASVYEEGDEEVLLENREIMGWKGGWEKFVGLGLVSRIS